MDEYRIDTKELWYYILYPIILVASLGTLFGFETLIATYIQYFVPSVDMKDNLLVHGLSTGILVGIILVIITIIAAIPTKGFGIPSGIVSGVSVITENPYVTFQFLGAIVLATVIYIAVVNLNTFFYPSSSSTSSTKNNYEPTKESFADGSTINQTLQQVQQVTQTLQKSLDTLSAATDDTCFVMRGIERRFLDNATAPEEETPSPAEAKEIKAQKLPGAKKQWYQKKQDWSATHGQVSMIECFTDGSLSELVTANQQLTDLLASAPVQRVVAQVKSLQTSATFSQSYIDQLVAKLNGEEFDNPTPEDTIETSKKLIARANDVQASIRIILDSTRTLKKNYAAIDAKSNDPNTVNNLAGKNV